MKSVDDGDVILVTRLDRLARSTRDLLNTLALIGEKKAGFRFLSQHGVVMPVPSLNTMKGDANATPEM